MAVNELNIEKYFLILRSQARLIAGIFTLAIFIAGTITYMSPKMYTATTSLNFDFSAANPADGSRPDVFARDAYIITQKNIIESQLVAQKVVDSLSDYERDLLVSALNSKSTEFDRQYGKIKRSILSLFSDEKKWREVNTSGEEVLQIKSAYDWLAQSIGADLVVLPVFNSRLVNVSYSSTQRGLAAFLANRFAEEYIAANLEMLIDPARKSKVWFDEQLNTLRDRLEDAQSRLTAYQRQEGIVAKDERLDAENTRLESLSKQLVAAQQTTRNAITEQQKLEQVLASGKSLMTFRPVFDNPAVQKISTDIRDYKARIAEASSRLGENHPRMKQLRSELSAAKSRLNAEIQVITNGIGNATELAQERESELAKAVSEQKQLVLDLKHEHDRITVLMREVESAQATYNAALAQMNTTSMRSMVDQTNVSIVDPANIPSTHSSPSWTKNLVLGMLGGLLLGIGAAVFMEIFIPRVYSKDDLLIEMGVPLLGHLKKA